MRRIAFAAMVILAACTACSDDPTSADQPALTDRLEVISRGGSVNAGQLIFSGSIQKLSLDSLQVVLTISNAGESITTQLSPCFFFRMQSDSSVTSPSAFTSDKVRVCQLLAPPVTFEREQIQQHAFAFRAGDMTAAGVAAGRYYVFIDPLTAAPLTQTYVFAGIVQMR